MKLSLVNCERVLLEEIGTPSMTRRDVAKTYALALRSLEVHSVDWEKVNGAIIDRWSVDALVKIKSWAWSGKAFDANPEEEGDE